MGNHGWLAGLCLVLTLLGACARPRTEVVLMPDADGRVGAVEVSNARGRRILDQPRQAVSVSGRDRAPGVPEILSEARIEAEFGPAIAARPRAPQHFILQFETGTSELTEASRPLIGEILRAIREQAPLDVSVVGHTDTAGSEELNNRLARERAEAVARMLVGAGADPGILGISSHGKAVLLVPTGDQVQEPRNRRVEVTVR